MTTEAQAVFAPQGNTAVVAAASSAPLGVKPTPDIGINARSPINFRFVNASSNLVHIGVGATAAAAQTNAVAATAGNPANGIALPAGAVEIMRFPANSYFSGYAASASTVYVMPGEGL